MQASYIPYLVLNDYLTTIRSDQFNNQLLDAVEEGGDFERMEAESFAIDKVRSIIGSQYYLDFEFRPTLPFSWNKKYYAGDRIIIDFPDWVKRAVSESEEDEVLGYVEGDCRIYSDGFGYLCVKPNTGQSFNIGVDWICIGKKWDIYFVNYPYQIFQLNPGQQLGITTPGLYREKEAVCWLKKIYICRNNSFPLNHQAREQYFEINNIPSPNIFPNFPNPQYTDGNYQWIDKGEFFLQGVRPSYPFEVSEDLNDGVDAWTDQYRKNWTFGDNRSSNIKQILVALSISVLSSRNSYIQKVRRELESWAYAELRKIKSGDITTLIPILQPDQNNDVAHGGSPKIINKF